MTIVYTKKYLINLFKTIKTFDANNINKIKFL